VDFFYAFWGVEGLWDHRHLVGIRSLTREDILSILDRAMYWREFLEHSPKSSQNLSGYSMVCLFFEPSTRTRLSFEMAGRLLGMNVVSFSTEGSSLEKGESFRDTVRTIARMKPDVVVVRHRRSGIPEYIADFLSCHVVNAGDGLREHPTQALLDLLAICRKFGRVEGLRVAIVGDVLHSRVARSLSLALGKLGNSVVVSGPSTLVPEEVEVLGVKRVFPVERAIQGVDVVYLLRIQRERQEAGYFPSLREYFRFFGLRESLLSSLKDGAIIMHPGPVNRNVEIEYGLVEHDASLIEEQVTCGVAVRMAVLEMLIGEGKGL